MYKHIACIAVFSTSVFCALLSVLECFLSVVDSMHMSQKVTKQFWEHLRKTRVFKSDPPSPWVRVYRCSQADGGLLTDCLLDGSLGTVGRRRLSNK